MEIFTFHTWLHCRSYVTSTCFSTHSSTKLLSCLFWCSHCCVQFLQKPKRSVCAHEGYISLVSRVGTHKFNAEVIQFHIEITWSSSLELCFFSLSNLNQRWNWRILSECNSDILLAWSKRLAAEARITRSKRRLWEAAPHSAQRYGAVQFIECQFHTLQELQGGEISWNLAGEAVVRQAQKWQTARLAKACRYRSGQLVSG